MSDVRLPEDREDPASSPTVEVRVYRDSTLLLRELCDSEEDAAEAAQRWDELTGVWVEVDDLSPLRPAAESFEPELDPADVPGEEHVPQEEP